MIILVNKKTRSLFCKGKVISLSRNEFTLFIFMIKSRKAREIDVADLILQIWEARYKSISANNISQLFYLLRKKVQIIDPLLNLTYSKIKGVQFFIPKSLVFIICNEKLYFFLQKKITWFRKFTRRTLFFI